MSDELMKNAMLEEVPEAGPHYWTRVDASLKNIEVTDGFIKTGAPKASPNYGTQEGMLERVEVAAAPGPGRSKFTKAMLGTAAGLFLVLGGVFIYATLQSSNSNVALESTDEAAVSDIDSSAGAPVPQAQADEAAEESFAASESSDEAMADVIESDSAVESVEKVARSAASYGWYDSVLSQYQIAEESEISFASGSSAANFGGVISDGEASVFSFDATAGQNVTVIVSGDGQPAVFDLYDPNGDSVAESEALYQSDVVESGQYFVVVKANPDADIDESSEWAGRVQFS